MALCFPIGSERKISGMAAREHRETQYVEQTKKTVPLVTREISLCQYVCELVLGVNVFVLDLGVQIDCVAHPIKSNSVGSGHVSHCWISSFDNHLDDSFGVFKNVQLRLALRRMCVGGYVIYI